MDPQRVGIIGATFDPIHFTHLMFIKLVLLCGLFSKVVLYPAGYNRFKPSPTEARHRVNMLKLGIPDKWLYPRNYWAELEVNYSVIYEADIPTVERIRMATADHPEGTTITYITGSDHVTVDPVTKTFPMQTWDEPDELMKSSVLIIPRIGFAKKGDSILPETFTWLDLKHPLPERSSTDIRSSIANGDSKWETMVPPSVVKYIKLRRLYQGDIQ